VDAIQYRRQLSLVAKLVYCHPSLVLIVHREQTTPVGFTTFPQHPLVALMLKYQQPLN
jgi:hypothetical protein